VKPKLQYAFGKTENQNKCTKQKKSSI